MFIKIYFGNRPLYLCDEITPELEPFIHHDDAIFIDELDSHTVKTMIHEMEKPSVHAGVFYHPDLDELIKAFRKKFTVIRAGGGIVRDQDNRVLVIFRRGKWDLPKGKIDEGETMEECALREVEEETGIGGLTLTNHFTTTYHTYQEGSKHVYKESHWYLMRADSDQPLLPQEEEGIDIVQWMNLEDITSILPGAYPSVQDVLTAYLSGEKQE